MNWSPESKIKYSERHMLCIFPIPSKFNCLPIINTSCIFLGDSAASAAVLLDGRASSLLYCLTRIQCRSEHNAIYVPVRNDFLITVPSAYWIIFYSSIGFLWFARQKRTRRLSFSLYFWSVTTEISYKHIFSVIDTIAGQSFLCEPDSNMGRIVTAT